MKWAYGVTTVPMRQKDLLPRTLASLAKAGFDKPRLFIDDCSLALGIDFCDQFGLEITARWPAIRTFGNWALGLAELYIRYPTADRYAMFQDDLVACTNLRAYLEVCPYPSKVYLNLYTFPQNLLLAKGRRGWYPSNQMGRGAVALVFSRDAVVTLLCQSHMVNRPQDAHKGWKSIDGGIVTAFKLAGWQEYVHNPSLVQHVGTLSSMRNHPHPQADSFPGEDFDALSLVC